MAADKTYEAQLDHLLQEIINHAVTFGNNRGLRFAGSIKDVRQMNADHQVRHTAQQIKRLFAEVAKEQTQ
jgi:hypothetical protein